MKGTAMTDPEPKKDNIINRLIDDSRMIIIFSIAFAFGMTLLCFCATREQSYGFISCAILWGLSLIALAISDKKGDSEDE